MLANAPNAMDRCTTCNFSANDRPADFVAGMPRAMSERKFISAREARCARLVARFGSSAYLSDMD